MIPELLIFLFDNAGVEDQRFVPPQSGRTNNSIASEYHHFCIVIQGSWITALCRISRDVFAFPLNKENSNKLDFRVNENNKRKK